MFALEAIVHPGPFAIACEFDVPDTGFESVGEDHALDLRERSLVVVEEVRDSAHQMDFQDVCSSHQAKIVNKIITMTRIA